MTPKIPFLDLQASQRELGSELPDAILRVIEASWYLLGQELEEFEREFAAYCGVRHCVGVGSGMAALELTLRAAGIGPGDEVIVPAYTWVATWLAVSATGAAPVGVDVLESTYNIDPAQVEGAITPRTAAIIPVHLRGEPADMEAIRSLAEPRGLFVLEDAAQAHGARCGGARAGSLGDAAAFSFYPAKNLGALGDGGAVTTNDADLADRLRLLRNYGVRDRYEIETAGVNSRLAEIQCAALRVKLPRLDRWNRARAEHSSAYVEAFAGSESLGLPKVPAWAEPVWHLFLLTHPDRDACRRALSAGGIETLVHYPVLPHLSGAYAEGKWPQGSFPIAERLSRSSLSLPLYPQLLPAQRELIIERVAATVADHLSQ